MAPDPFQKPYVLHATDESYIIPVVWAFLGSKSEECFKKSVKLLSRKIEEKISAPFLPEFIITDYETSIIPAISKSFPYSTHILDAISTFHSVWSEKSRFWG